jgi:hypothetical protein
MTTALAVVALGFVGLAVGIWTQWHKARRTWTEDDDLDFRAEALAYQLTRLRERLRREQEAAEFDQLRRNLWGER